MACCPPKCDPAKEPLQSALANFIKAFFGNVIKTCVNNQVVWSLPCNLEAGLPGYPKLVGEGAACYILRLFLAITSAFGIQGYRTTALSALNVTLQTGTDVIHQNFTGILAAPVDIAALSSGAAGGSVFFLYIEDVQVTALNTLTIKSDGTVLKTFNTAGTLNGFLKLVYTGTIWKIVETSVSIT